MIKKKGGSDFFYFFNRNVLSIISLFVSGICVLASAGIADAQEESLKYTLDVNAPVISLPRVFKPNVDLSGRGFNNDQTWPQALSSRSVLDLWRAEIGVSGIFRVQFNLWEISQFQKNKDLQERLLENYERVFKEITDAGGVILLNLFSTPAGLGSVLDKKSYPSDLRVFKAFVKKYIRRLSCIKRYNIWYEVWSAPDLDDFFLGRKQEYFNLYRAVAESIVELREETKVHIPVGGPSTSWWFQNFDGNTIIYPEKSLIYELIRFCYHKRLPLDFITWHAYSSDPKIENEITRYNKPGVRLIRAWLEYFNFDRNTPLIVDEWNYDTGINIMPERGEYSYICASYIPSRLKNMFDAGIDYQLFFSLEDFQNNKEGVTRNVGIFWIEDNAGNYKGGSKNVYGVFKMLSMLGKDMYSSCGIDDEFAGVIATRSPDTYTMLIYNFIDREIAMNYISRNISVLKAAERKVVLGFIKSGKMKKIINKEILLSSLRLRKRIRTLLNKAQLLNDEAKKYKEQPRKIKIELKNLKGQYLYQRYAVNSNCSDKCDFLPVEEKNITGTALYEETLQIEPYSVYMVVLKKKAPGKISGPSGVAAKDAESAKPNLSPEIADKPDAQESGTVASSQESQPASGIVTDKNNGASKNAESSEPAKTQKKPRTAD